MPCSPRISAHLRRLEDGGAGDREALGETLELVLFSLMRAPAGCNGSAGHTTSDPVLQVLRQECERARLTL